jgi:hypothetical protein
MRSAQPWLDPRADLEIRPRNTRTAGKLVHFRKRDHYPFVPKHHRIVTKSVHFVRKDCDVDPQKPQRPAFRSALGAESDEKSPYGAHARAFAWLRA